MLDRLIAFALSQRLLAVLAALALVLAGVAAYRALPIDAFPDITPTQVKLILKAPGMTPEEVEARVVVPLEQELLGIPHTLILRSITKYAIADITLDFVEGTDLYWARQQVAERFAAARDVLPMDVSGGLAPITTPLSDMIMFTIEGGGLSLAERRTLLDWTLRPALRTVPGVAEVNALGGKAETFEVIPERAKLSAAGVSFSDVMRAIEANNRNDGAGRLSEGDSALIVRSEGAIKSLHDLRQIVLRAPPGQPALRVGDVAEVRMGSLTRYGAVTKDGVGEAVEGIVVGLRGADAARVVRGVEARLAELKPSLPQGVRIEVFYNRSTLITRAVGTVERALLEATLLVVVLLLLFLGDLRAALVVSLTLPLAALITFLLMRGFGMSANLMSLGGLAIAIGMLVDAAVVVIENTVSALGHADKALPRLHRIWRATAAVAKPVTAGILIIVLVFLPLLSLQGLEGKLFAPVALTIVFALAASLLLSLTVIPVLASFLLKEGAHREPWLMRMLERGYTPLLDWALTHPKTLGIAAAVSLLLGGAAYVNTGKTFMPTMDEGDLLMQLMKPPAISLERSAAIDLAVEQRIRARIPEVEHVIARLGSDELGLDPMGLNETDMFLQLKPQDQWRRKDKAFIAEELRAIMRDFPGIEYGFTQPIEMRVAEMLTGSRGDVAVKIFGPDLHVLDQLTQRIAAVLEATPGASDVLAQANEGVQYLSVRIGRDLAGRYGLDAVAVQDELRAQVEGRRAGIVQQGERRVPLLVRGDAELARNPSRFARLDLTRPDGTLPLQALATIERSAGPVAVRRENAQRYALIQANVSGRDLVGFVADAQARTAKDVPLPPGYSLAWGGQFENQQRAAARLGLVVPVALALIFLVLFTTFGSLRQAALILANVPFAMVGGLVALWLTREYLSVPASVGFIALLGIAMLNGLVLVGYFNQLRAEGMDMAQAVRQGAIRRLRPVMMTASITALGLVPLLFASGPGSEVQRPLAIVVIGGLISSTALTLLLLPVLFRRFGEDRR
ncbi:efflux RND transporter permease subunit [Metallibacterium scheffleri]|uniref:CusA/CzcA family heavy metal efflux RND transporter n=2 Tax=root TaxID=1 RepID=A0A4S3KSB3_9GAMM|nr:CusA/CzcA family heavy metal efflux RND transporter [Metallibacterium scheffleri]THD11985.1 CusA/CzcA family heavy metal efflux RND transporter [Metallibacterium scheffleri]